MSHTDSCPDSRDARREGERAHDHHASRYSSPFECDEANYYWRRGWDRAEERAQERRQEEFESERYVQRVREAEEIEAMNYLADEAAAAEEAGYQQYLADQRAAEEAVQAQNEQTDSGQLDPE